VTFVAFAEQVMPFGDRLRQPVGGALIVAGLVMLLR
jgi:hypothetical protein